MKSPPLRRLGTTPAGLRPENCIPRAQHSLRNPKQPNSQDTRTSWPTAREGIPGTRHLPRGGRASRSGRQGLGAKGAKTGTNRALPTSRQPAQPGACARPAREGSFFIQARKPRLSGRGGPRLGGRREDCRAPRAGPSGPRGAFFWGWGRVGPRPPLKSASKARLSWLRHPAPGFLGSWGVPEVEISKNRATGEWASHQACPPQGVSPPCSGGGGQTPAPPARAAVHRQGGRRGCPWPQRATGRGDGTARRRAGFFGSYS